MVVFYRLQPKVDVLQQIRSGGDNTKWIEARFNVTKQMKVMIGQLTDEQVMKDSAGKKITCKR